MIENEKRMTLLDVAKEAGVSRATASLVVRGSALVSAGTRKKVEKAMEKLGYIYNQAAANLRAHQSNTVGLIINDIGNPYFSDLVEGVQEKLGEYRYNVIIGSSFKSTEKQNVIFEMMMENKVCGVILFPVEQTSLIHLSRFKMQGIPVVTGGRELGEAGLDYVGIDNFYGVQQAIHSLAELGHKRIAFLSSADNEIPSQERTEGYLDTMKALKLPVRSEWLKKCVATREKAYEGVGDFFKNKKTAPTAIICYNDTMAFGVMRRLWDEGIEPGKDVAVIGFDGVREGTTSHPRLTSVSQNGQLIGREAASLLHQRIQGLKDPAKKIIFKPEMAIRESSKIELK